MEQVCGEAIEASDQLDAAGDEVPMGDQLRNVIGSRTGRDKKCRGTTSTSADEHGTEIDKNR
jgi:hypothetical protein